MRHRSPPGLSSPVLAALVGIVVLLRIAAWLAPSSYVTVAAPAALPLNALGVLFFASGLWAWARRPTRLTRVFLRYGAGMGLHWGGTFGVGVERIDLAVLSLYAAATALGDGAFLDLARRVPAASPRQVGAPDPVALTALAPYILAIVTAVGTPIVLVLPRATAASALAAMFAPVVIALVMSSGLDLLAEAGRLPGEPDLWKLAYGLVPLALARLVIRADQSNLVSSARASR